MAMKQVNENAKNSTPSPHQNPLTYLHHSWHALLHH